MTKTEYTPPRADLAKLLWEALDMADALGLDRVAICIAGALDQLDSGDSGEHAKSDPSPN